ncbi:MAG: acyltransferase family protein [bacterium]
MNSRTSNRSVPLDTFRGITILLMLLVNNVAIDIITPYYLKHAPWGKGVTIADLVMPWFLMIVGIAIPFSLSSSKRRGIPLWKYNLRALNRTIKLFLIGCFLTSSIYKQPYFGMEVLQLIGLTYFVGVIFCPLYIPYRALIATIFLILHWAMIKFIPIPGIGVGIFTEEKNIIKYIDTAYLQRLHLNGIISVIPTSGLVIIGSIIGNILMREGTKKNTYILFATGALLTLSGWVWNLDIPFNKPYWTSSYILYTAGLGTILLGIIYLLVEVIKWKKWTFPFVVLGRNAILAYILPILFKVYVLDGWRWRMPNGSILSVKEAILHLLISKFGITVGGWSYTILYILVWWLFFLYLYLRKIFVKI